MPLPTMDDLAASCYRIGEMALVSGHLSSARGERAQTMVPVYLCSSAASSDGCELNDEDCSVMSSITPSAQTSACR